MSKNSNKQDRKSGNNQNKMKRIEYRFIKQLQDQEVSDVRLTFQGTISSSGIGVIANSVAMDPSGAGEWGTYGAIWDEFRVLGIRITLVSAQQYSVTAVNKLGGVAYDNDSVTALTSVANVLEYSTSHTLPAIFGHKSCRENQTMCQQYSWLRPTAGAPIPWIDVATPAGSTGGVLFYFAGLTVSTLYFDINVEYFVQFRGRR